MVVVVSGASESQMVPLLRHTLYIGGLTSAEAPLVDCLKLGGPLHIPKVRFNPELMGTPLERQIQPNLDTIYIYIYIIH